MKQLTALSAGRIAITAAILTATSTTAADSANRGGVYRAPLSAEPVTLDPARFSDIYSMSVAANIFDGLVQFDEQLKVVPAIASIWKISRDKRTYTFILRDDVKFHHGRTVTAEDFVFSMSRILHPATKSPVASLLMKIHGAQAYNDGASNTVSGLQAIGPHLLRIELEEPFAPFLSILAMINAKVIPHDQFSEEFARKPVGTGPFIMESWQPGEQITLRANPDYFAGAPNLDRLRFRIYPNGGFERIFAEFQNGELDHALIPSDRYDQIVADPAGYTIVTKPGLNLIYVGLNAHVAPLGDVRVRQAINYAVDTDHIVATITKRGTVPARGILPPGISGFDPDFPGYGYDPARARELLSEAGFPGGAGFPALEVWTVSNSESVKQELDAYRAYLAAVGIPLTVRVADNWKAFVGKITAGDAAMFYAAWYADYPDPDNFFYPLSHSRSRYNRMGFNNPQVDALIERARTSTDYLERADLYRDAERMVMQGAPIVSQHTSATNILFQRWVHGAQASRLGAIYLPFHQIWFDAQRRTDRGASGLAANSAL